MHVKQSVKFIDHINRCNQLAVSCHVPRIRIILTFCLGYLKEEIFWVGESEWNFAVSFIYCLQLPLKIRISPSARRRVALERGEKLVVSSVDVGPVCWKSSLKGVRIRLTANFTWTHLLSTPLDMGTTTDWLFSGWILISKGGRSHDVPFWSFSTSCLSWKLKHEWLFAFGAGKFWLICNSVSSPTARFVSR
jgi:hypothetical protein